MRQGAPAHTGRGRRVYVESYGCTTNLGDARQMAAILDDAGHELVSSPDDADLVLVNTCTVIDTTQQRIENRFAELRAQDKDIVVAGCMAAAQPDEVRAVLPDAPLVTPRRLDQVAEVVAGRPLAATFRPKTRLPRALGATDAVVQLAEGCFFSCSYCLTKKARGEQSSYPIDELVADIRDAVNAGAVDIRLTAQDTSGYGMDAGTDLAALMRRIGDIGGAFKVRVGMMHPKTAHRQVQALMDAYDHERFYQFLHLPIQTGSTAMLRAMKRGHDMAEFWAVVDTFRDRFPKGTVSTDIIVGFPGETDDDHHDTLTLLRRLRAEHVNITRFAARPHTDAKTMAGRVPSDVAKRRSREATELVWSMLADHYRGRIGERFEVTTLEPGKRPDSVMARGPAYEPVAVLTDDGTIELGTRFDVVIEDAGPTYLIGRAATEPRHVAKVAEGPVRKVAGLRLPVLA